MSDTAGRTRASRTVVTTSDAETQLLGEEVGRLLEPGTFVLLYGDLGAGKTAFVRGLARGLGVDPDEVSSPTFTLVQRYAGRLVLQHVDLYRIERLLEVEELGLDELAREGAVVAIEWADRLAGTTPVPAVIVVLRDLGDDRREIEIAGTTR